MMKARLAAAGLGVATALLFAACGNGPPAGEGGTSGAASGGGDVGTKVTATSGAATVDMTDSLKFQPASASVKVGDTVLWTNGSSVAHNVTFDSYSSISSDSLSNGDKYAVKFTKAGSYQYHCTFHPGMDGTVSVS
jgi:plastocyanin